MSVVGHDRPSVQAVSIKIKEVLSGNTSTGIGHPHSAPAQNEESKSKSDVSPKRPSSAETVGSAKKNGCTYHVTLDSLKKLKQRIDKAVRDHKIFYMQSSFPTIRIAMRRRDWIEKRNNKLVSHLNEVTDDTEDKLLEFCLTFGSDAEAVLTSHLLKKVCPDFLWTTRRDWVDWSSTNRAQIVSRFPRSYFTTKIGLCSSLQNSHWFFEEGVADPLFPRCYNITTGDDKIAFIADFRLTACVNLLRWLVEKYEEGGELQIIEPYGTIPVCVVRFAVERCDEFVCNKMHYDIDKETAFVVDDCQWKHFLECYYRIAHEGHLLMKSLQNPITVIYPLAKKALANIRKYLPGYSVDGILNIWILKPGNRCRGQGIHLYNRLDAILAKVNPNNIKNVKYVIQKYIERPLLIMNTKFDIRQWFLLTSVCPLQIWMYKDCYLRFSSQHFSLNNFHESVHLCNNAVQCKYINASRDESLPSDNMWDCRRFQEYLRSIGRNDTWEKVVYPGMKSSLIGALLSSQDTMESRVNCFELFGADFILGEDFSPWLLEINACPAMGPTTRVTARLCGQCLEDVIKVVVDRRRDLKASTGQFVCEFTQTVCYTPSSNPERLMVKGDSLIYKTAVAVPLQHVEHNHCRYQQQLQELDKKEERRTQSAGSTGPETERIPTPKGYKGPVIYDFIDTIRSKSAEAGSQRYLRKIANYTRFTSKYAHLDSSPCTDKLKT